MKSIFFLIGWRNKIWHITHSETLVSRWKDWEKKNYRRIKKKKKGRKGNMGRKNGIESLVYNLDDTEKNRFVYRKIFLVLLTLSFFCVTLILPLS